MNARRKDHWPQFRLATLLLATSTTVLAVGWSVERARHRRTASQEERLKLEVVTQREVIEKLENESYVNVGQTSGGEITRDWKKAMNEYRQAPQAGKMPSE